MEIFYKIKSIANAKINLNKNVSLFWPTFSILLFSSEHINKL